MAKNRKLVVYEEDTTTGEGAMFALDPNAASGIPLPAFTSGPVTPNVGGIIGEAFLNTTTGAAYVWNGTRWNAIVPTSILTYATDALVRADTVAPVGSYAVSSATGNFFVRFNQAGTLLWRQIGTSHYSTQAGMLADTPPDGTFAYAQDVNLFFCFKGGIWHPESEILADEAVLLGLSPGVIGQRGIATDTGRNFTWSGTAWLGDPFRTYATQAALMADNTPAVGTVATAKDTNNIFMKNAVGWTGMNVAGSAPVGEIIMFPSLTPPANFLLCDGSSFNATTFPQLAAVLGGNTLPDLRGQFVRGASATRAPLSKEAQATARPTTALTGTTNNTGAHAHGMGSYVAAGAGMSKYGEDNLGVKGQIPLNSDATTFTRAEPWTRNNGDHTHTVTINGGGDAETRPANTALAFHIRATL